VDRVGRLAVNDRTPRPRILLPARFSASASALRFQAEVNARKLIEAVYRAGGEPLSVHPSTDSLTVDALENRFGFADGLLLPGGGDLDPSHYGGQQHATLYDVDPEQDRFDLALADWALATGRPVLAICRGLQVANVQLGGTVTAHMDDPHRHVVSELKLETDSELAQLTGTDRLSISCYHHQCLDTLGRGLRAVAHGADGTVEAVELDHPGWFVGVQWHPEDTADVDPHQARIFGGLVAAAAAGLAGGDR
jgi:putative glutamine amidotransferase